MPSGKQKPDRLFGPYHSRHRKWKRLKQKADGANRLRQQTYDRRRRITVLTTWQEGPLTHARCIVFRIRAEEGQYRFKPPGGAVEKLGLGKDGKVTWRRLWDRSKPQLATLIRRAVLQERSRGST
jgi:hypothetical protein